MDVAAGDFNSRVLDEKASAPVSRARLIARGGAKALKFAARTFGEDMI